MSRTLQRRDDVLARRVARGDEAACSALFHRYHPRLELYCRSITRNDADAQDAAQTALTKAFAALRAREPERATRAPAGALGYLRRLWYDTGLSNHALAVRPTIDLAGAGRIVFGTDWPYADLPAEGTVLGALPGGGAVSRARGRTCRCPPHHLHRAGRSRPAPPGRAAGQDPVAAGVCRRWVRAVWRRPVPAVRTAMARALRLPASTTRRLARVTAV